ncbi:MAG TPA: hypothetical protein VJG32_17970 [Anaerolineae bacterium]|nr:hypothetical protein [Anaerolineae bacterium]
MITTPRLDDFERPSGALGANWQNDITEQGGGSGLVIDGGQAATANALIGSAWYTALQTSRDCEVWALMDELPDSDVPVPGLGYVELFLRMSNPGDVDNLSAYTVMWQNDGSVNGVLRIRYYHDGLVGPIEEVEDCMLAPGDVLFGRAIGDTIQAWVLSNGVWNLVAEVTDTNIADGGYLGAAMYGDNGRIEEFGGGTWEPVGVTLYLTKDHRELRGSPVHQGQDEAVYYKIDVSALGADPTDLSIVVKDKSVAATVEDVTASLVDSGLVFSFPSSTRVVLPFIINPTDRHRYRVEVLMTIAGQVVEPWFTLFGEQ